MERVKSHVLMNLLLGVVCTFVIIMMVSFGVKAMEKKKMYERAVDWYKNGELTKAQIGDTIKFGDYNGNTEWIVLEKTDEKILVLSKYALEKRQFDTYFDAITWDNSHLREWLNTDYYNMAFDDMQKSLIIRSHIDNSDDVPYTEDGKDTDDYLFVLSVSEARQYFNSDEDRIASLPDGEIVSWWLRNPGYHGNEDTYVYTNGTVHDVRGYNVMYRDAGVRPAMWIDISNL